MSRTTNRSRAVAASNTVSSPVEATATKDGDWRMKYWVWQVGRRGVTAAVFMHSRAAEENRLGDDPWTIFRHMTFTGDRNPFFVKPKEPEKK